MKIARKASSMELSIIIVNYNTLQLTEQAIDSIVKNITTFDYEVIDRKSVV